ncbi:hypothetical protein CWR48_10625 [Oceanobacillus arenosus]|uniref:PTS mannose transporter subunit IID n=1 Tax=Oceanobacillus arenosus TaxID=1229153 RepID=A0A3D8PPJ5_9BACI|nr:phage holin [Oceanobacillus arenosus]RDW18050.1 hypothetical protein CWR48_10625 [Oceanobacillus arenosus]
MFKTNLTVEKEVKQEAKTGLIMQFTGMLSALIPVLALLGVKFDWLTQEFVDSLYLFLVALAPLVLTFYTIYKNHYSGKKAQEQNEVLKKEGLK